MITLQFWQFSHAGDLKGRSRDGRRLEGRGGGGGGGGGGVQR